jgi:hypothetical protein
LNLFGCFLRDLSRPEVHFSSNLHLSKERRDSLVWIQGFPSYLQKDIQNLKSLANAELLKLEKTYLTLACQKNRTIFNEDLMSVQRQNLGLA